MRSNQNLTQMQKFFSLSWHLFRHPNFQNRTIQSKVSLGYIFLSHWFFWPSSDYLKKQKWGRFSLTISLSLHSARHTSVASPRCARLGINLSKLMLNKSITFFRLPFKLSNGQLVNQVKFKLSTEKITSQKFRQKFDHINVKYWHGKIASKKGAYDIE